MANSIIKTAANLAPPTTLVLGSSGSGKSTVVRDEILRSEGWKALWVAFSNTAALVDNEATANWAVAVPDSWIQFKEQIVNPAIAGEFKDYNTLVWDGLNVSAPLALNAIAPNKQPTQADWGDSSEAIRDALVSLRSHFDRVFIIVDVVNDDKGGKKTAVNPYLHNLIVPLCGNKWFTYVRPLKDEKTGQATGIEYGVQRNSAMALNFTPNAKK